MKRWQTIAAVFSLVVALVFGVLVFRPRPAPVYPTRFIPSSAKAGEEKEKPCPGPYKRLFSGETLEIRIVFGYKDARPARFVGDRYESMIFAQYLTSPCRPGWNACGFERDRNDPELFRRKIRWPDGKDRTVNLMLVQSAAGPDDSENRKDSFQKWKSVHASRMFLEGLRTADVVFYNGHSRDGGGPDFGPPVLAGGEHVAYAWYARNKPGLRKLLSGLEGKTRTKLLGLFSCASGKHFLNEVADAKPGLATITSSKLLYYADALQAQLGALSAILGQECETGFGQALRPHPEAGNSRINGFFKN